MRSLFFLPLILLWVASGCQNPASQEVPATHPATGTALRAPALDAAFRALWDDGSAEVTTYTTERLRGGSLRKGSATAVIRRAAFSEEDRVAEPDNGLKAPQQHDLFPAMQMNWMERYQAGAEACEEMTTSVLTLSSIEGRTAGTETKTDFSAHSWDGQVFHQLLFDATGVRSHQYSFQKEGDEQITLSYPRDGVSADALWFWARGMAAPLIDSSQQHVVDLLPSLRDVRERREPLSWKKATLTRLAGAEKTEQFLVRGADGGTETFVVESTAPFRILRWQSSDGEHAELVNSSRMKSWEPPASVSRK